MSRRSTPDRTVDLMAHPEASLGFLLKQVHHLTRLGIEERMRAARLEQMTYAHAVTLHSLIATPGCSGAELARAAMVTPQTMNSIIVNLETQGLVERKPDPSHGRILLTFITEKGRRHFERGVAAAEGFLEEMETALTASERRDLRRLLMRCLQRLGAMTGIDELDRFGLRPMKTSKPQKASAPRSATGTSQRA
jgi:DNA-binding MarR family transcriptional regulator